MSKDAIIFQRGLDDGYEEFSRMWKAARVKGFAFSGWITLQMGVAFLRGHVTYSEVCEEAYRQAYVGTIVRLHPDDLDLP